MTRHDVRTADLCLLLSRDALQTLHVLQSAHCQLCTTSTESIRSGDSLRHDA